MTTPQTVLAIAAGEIGYSRWADKARGTKYARETQPVFWPRDTWLLANGIAFCDIFVTWVFWKAGAISILPAGASYNTDYRASKGGRVPKSSARPGDVLVFDWNWATPATNHVGILERVLPSGNFQTIEGNTSPGNAGSQSNGGGVYRRTRKPGTVRYVIRPQWASATVAAGQGTAKPVPAKAPATVAAGKVARLTVDRRAGRDTIRALQAFLNSRVKARTLTVDGRAGEDTWRSLQEYLGVKPADGKIGWQSYKPSELGNGIVDRKTAWGYTGRGSKGSPTVRALQRWVGVKPDGVWGEGTTGALQSKLNAHGVGM